MKGLSVMMMMNLISLTFSSETTSSNEDGLVNLPDHPGILPNNETGSSIHRELETVGWDERYSYLGLGGCKQYDGNGVSWDVGTVVINVQQCRDTCNRRNFRYQDELRVHGVLVAGGKCWCQKGEGIVVRSGEDNDQRKCYANVRGNQLVGTDLEDEFFFAGEGICQGSFNNIYLPVSYAYIHEYTRSDYLCAEKCRGQAHLAGFARSRSGDICYCMFEKVISGVSVKFPVSGDVGEGDVVVDGETFLNFQCYGYNLRGNEIQGATTGFVYKGNGECYGGNGQPFPYYQVPGSTKTDTDAECARECLEDGYSGLVGIQRNRKDLRCYCVYDSQLTLPSPQNNRHNLLDAAALGTASQSTPSGAGPEDVSGAHLAIDGNTYQYWVPTGNSISHSGLQTGPWWQLELHNTATISGITIYHRWDDCCRGRLNGAEVILRDASGNDLNVRTLGTDINVVALTYSPTITGVKTVIVKRTAFYGFLHLAEVQLFGPASNGGGGTGTATAGGSKKEFVCYGVDPGSRIHDCPTSAELETTLTNNKQTLNSVCKCDAGGNSIYGVNENCPCPQVSGFCTSGDYHYIDCDEDGANDSLCVDGTGYQLLLSDDSCHESTGTGFLGDACSVAKYGNQPLGDWASKYFWAGIGICLGSYNNQRFSHFSISGTVTTDEACAQKCAATAGREQYVVAFFRRIYTNKCFCQFQKNTAGFTVNYAGNGIGGVVAGTDNRFACYGHYQLGNQLIPGKTGFEFKGIGPCSDRNRNRFPHFQITGQLTSDTDAECAERCLQAYPEGFLGFDGIVGVTRHKKTRQCYCVYDSKTTLPSSFSSTKWDAGTGTGEVTEGWLDEYSCNARVQGRSGFKYIGIGRCRDSANRRFRHFQMPGLTAHTDAQCGQSCLEAFPEGIVGFTRHKKTFVCYCAYSSGTTLPSPISGYNQVWNNGGTGTVAQGTDGDYPYTCYAVDETSRLSDCPPNSVLTTDLDTANMKRLESWCDCDSSSGKDVYFVDETCTCARPYQWCTEPGDEYFHLDCDGDTTLDSVCKNATGYQTLLSSEACYEQEGTDINAVCPEVSGCPRPDGWCEGGAQTYYSLDCDGDGALDSFCRTTTNYWIRKSSNGCTQTSGPISDGECPAADGCTRPDDWCTARGNRYFFIDCDGDGALDSMCQTGDTQYLFKKSSDGCAETSASNVATACPVAGCVQPISFCGHRGSQYHYVDCDGDGKLDSHCRDRRGNSWTLASSKNCLDSGDRCTAADYCTHRDETCNHAGSHFYWVDPRGGDGNADIQCRADVGQKWADTLCYRPLQDVREEREYILNKS